MTAITLQEAIELVCWWAETSMGECNPARLKEAASLVRACTRPASHPVIVAQRQAVPQGWITELLATAEEGYEAAAEVSGSALLAGETPKAKQAEQRRLVYENACRALGSLYCVVDELRKQLSNLQPTQEDK